MTDPSLVVGLLTDCDLLGGDNGAFSAVFDADAVVGRIILARNESSGADTDVAMLGLEDCFFNGGGPIDDLLLPVFKAEVLRARGGFEAVVLARLGDRVAA